MSKKILAIGAHPDDIEFGVGAILIKQVKQGDTVNMLVLSKGEAASNGTPEQREEESRKAAELMGAKISFLDFGGDSHISRTNENAFQIAKAIRELKPNIVICPQPMDNQHPDHANVGQLVRNACRFARYGGIIELNELPAHTIDSLFFFPSTPNLESRPDILIDITGEKEMWEKVMSLHETQMKSRKYSELLLTMSHYYGMTIGVDYAWGLFRNDPIVIEDLNSITQSTPKF